MIHNHDTQGRRIFISWVVNFVRSLICKIYDVNFYESTFHQLSDFEQIYNASEK